MNKKLSVNNYCNFISSNDLSYNIFKNKKNYYKNFYVESSDDCIFYKALLSQLELPKTINITDCYNRDGVIRKCREDNKTMKNNKNCYIVDSDYKDNSKLKIDNLIFTTGYSMENFFFYKENVNYNFDEIFKEYYNIKKWKKKSQEYLVLLNEYMTKYLKYYAFLKACVESNQLSKNNQFYNHHQLLKHYIDEEELVNEIEIDTIINKEIAFYNTFEKTQIIKIYKQNIDFIKQNNFLFLRGHDIFNHLLRFIKSSHIEIDKNKILLLANKIVIPKDFLNKINNTKEDS